MLSSSPDPSPSPSPEEVQRRQEQALRSERNELRRSFYSFCAQNEVRLDDDARHDADTEGAVPRFLEAELDLLLRIRGEVARDHDKVPEDQIDNARVDITPTKVVLAGDRCFLLAHPTLSAPTSLEPQSMMPLAFIGTGETAGLYISSSLRNELFPPSTLVGVIAEYHHDGSHFEPHPVFTSRSFDIAVWRAQAIGLALDETRAANPRHSVTEITPSSIVGALLMSVDDSLPPPNDPDGRKWPILGLSRVSVPDGGGVCKIGFMRVGIATNTFVEEIHFVQLTLSRLGTIETQYKERHSENVRAN